MGRIFTIPLPSITGLTSTAPFLQIATPSTVRARLLEFQLGQINDETNEQVAVTFDRRSTASTMVAAATPLKNDPDGAISLLTGSTTTCGNGLATVTGTTGDVWPLPGFNLLTGLQWFPTPATQIIIGVSGFLTVQFAAAPATGSLTWNGYLVFEEV